MSDTPEIDAAELYYDGPTGFVPIEDARKVERKLNDALKENARLRPALMGFSQAEELMELREDLRKQLRCSLDLARQNNILQDYNKILGQELQDTKQERDELKAYADKLADGLPEGMLPKDVENLRNANAGLAEDLRKAKLKRGEALAALEQTCATNTKIRREIEEAHREIAKLKASSNENYWELSRQRGNMLHALHEISAAVKRGMRQGGITIGETEVLGRMEGRE
jgi:predicted RNase H-like nuclease (RuvC/YqgF family)